MVVVACQGQVLNADVQLNLLCLLAVRQQENSFELLMMSDKLNPPYGLAAQTGIKNPGNNDPACQDYGSSVAFGLAGEASGQ